MGRLGLGPNFIMLWAAPTIWTAMPAAKTELFGSAARMWLITEGFTEVAMQCVVYVTSASANTPVLFLEYSFDAVTWFTLTTTVGLAAGASSVSTWQPIP